MISTLPNLVLLALSSSVIYVLALIVYRLTLHPLAKYPGPFLAKITPFYDTYQSVLKNRAQDQYRCQQQYGPIFRYGPNHLIVQTAGALHDIYHNAKINNVRKSDQMLMFHDHGAYSTHSAIDKHVHAFKRRVMGHAFSEQALRSLEPHMIGTIDRWLATLAPAASIDRKGWSSPQNMALSANYMSLDVLGDLCFGRPFGLLESQQMRGIPELLSGRSKQFQNIGNSPLRYPYVWMRENTALEKYINPAAAKNISDFQAFVIDALKARTALVSDIEKSGSEPRKDFYYYLEQGKDPETGEGYTKREMLSELRLLVGAGSDTSATAVAAAFFYLTRYPQVLAKLQKELRDTFTDVQEIFTSPQLSSCHYLRAVIEETLRMSPPVGASLNRTVTEGGQTIDGIPLAAGTDVSTAIYAIHHSEEYFSEPQKFRPERWLPEYTSKDEIDRAKSAFCPFSLGNRGCIGKPMAYNEMSIALGRVFWLYDVRLSAGDATGLGEDGLYKLKDIFIAERDGPMVEFRVHDTERAHAPLMRNESALLSLDE